MVKSIPMLLRQNIVPRVLGFDDAPFGSRPRETLAEVNYVGIVTSAARFEGMLYGGELHHDGLNATDCIAESILHSKFHEQIHSIFIDGVTMGGLNVIDISSLAERTQRTVVAVMRRQPDVFAMLAACSRLPNYAERVHKIRAAGPVFQERRWIFQYKCPPSTNDAPNPEQIATLLDRCTPNESQKIPE